MYHNTTDSSGADLLDYRSKARSQDEIVLDYLTRNKIWRKGMTASEVHKALIENRYIKSNVPITSIRRALTNLVTSNKLIKTDKQWPGPMGRPEFIYALPQNHQLRLVL